MKWCEPMLICLSRDVGAAYGQGYCVEVGSGAGFQCYQPGSSAGSVCHHVGNGAGDECSDGSGVG